ncbi:sensor histidine kinase [Streptomyces sp. H10-C2]|uniref:sensor histidine kinase n=1 Tax=unclassified Streptomyces TaxID=2593676 RepID=UPI0024B9DFD8|nr:MULTISPECIES: sensor histidine kinase [unclassified Streptomyces]MDJ0344613.1 sensor histidine kinase [Streptomyces sp. PH10-H1]MDJ0373227.1 sensor histidine kinase [Streptomyces sp. H10-C2]
MASTGPLRRALRQAAAYAPWSAWAWRNTAFVTAGVPPAAASVLLIFALVTDWWSLILLPALLLVSGPLTALQRSRFWSLLGLNVPRVTRARPWYTPRGAWQWLRSEATWRQSGYHLLAAPLAATGAVVVVCSWVAGIFGTLVFSWVWALPVRDRLPGWTEQYTLVTGVGLVLLFLTPFLAAAVARLDTSAAAALLGPNRAKELRRRVEDLAESRAGVVDAADAERRRIERDLHDGAQQRLVSLAMNLGLARATLTDLPPEARKVIDEAHREAKEAIEELNNLVRGLHPAVLDDRGLDAALSGVAARAPLPVHLKVEMERRASPTVEAVAYFVVSEALANVAKHARADRVDVGVRRHGDVLRVTIIDDGIGGADVAGGTGLAGLAQRVGSVDGSIRINSPAGGPTIITVELPCGL